MAAPLFYPDPGNGFAGIEQAVNAILSTRSPAAISREIARLLLTLPRSEVVEALLVGTQMEMIEGDQAIRESEHGQQLQFLLVKAGVALGLVARLPADVATRSGYLLQLGDQIDRYTAEHRMTLGVGNPLALATTWLIKLVLLPGTPEGFDADARPLVERVIANLLAVVLRLRNHPTKAMDVSPAPLRVQKWVQVWMRTLVKMAELHPVTTSPTGEAAAAIEQLPEDDRLRCLEAAAGIAVETIQHLRWPASMEYVPDMARRILAHIRVVLEGQTPFRALMSSEHQASSASVLLEDLPACKQNPASCVQNLAALRALAETTRLVRRYMHGPLAVHVPGPHTTEMMLTYLVSAVVGPSRGTDPAKFARERAALFQRLRNACEQRRQVVGGGLLPDRGTSCFLEPQTTGVPMSRRNEPLPDALLVHVVLVPRSGDGPPWGYAVSFLSWRPVPQLFRRISGVIDNPQVNERNAWTWALLMAARSMKRPVEWHVRLPDAILLQHAMRLDEDLDQLVSDRREKAGVVAPAGVLRTLLRKERDTRNVIKTARVGIGIPYQGNMNEPVGSSSEEDTLRKLAEEALAGFRAGTHPADQL